MTRVVVVGTGTDVGKTHVTCALGRALRDAGSHVVAWKPIASGVSSAPGDAELIAEATRASVEPPLYAFVPPVSPHLAARDAGVTLSLEALASHADALAARAEVVLVETAGGLFSPLGAGVFNLDLVKRLAPARVLLVAPDRLGVLHDVRATVLAAAAAGVRFDAVVLSAPPVVDASSGTNAHELGVTSGLEVVDTFPRASWSSAASQAVAEKVVSALGLRRRS